MHLIARAPFASPRHAVVPAIPQMTLGTMCGATACQIRACQVNADFMDDWRAYVPDERDTITFFVGTEAVALGLATTGTLLATIINAAIVAVISTVISLGLSYLIRALTPTPANTAGKTEQVFGLSGLTNTTALGTPMFLVYGERRVFGHIINTSVAIADDGKATHFAILYFMGEGPVENIDDVEINDTAIAQYPGVSWAARLGDGNVDLPMGFDTISSVWSDGRSLDLTTPIVYTTRDTEVVRVVLIFATPFLFSQDGNGNHQAASHSLKIEYALAPAGSYTEIPGSPVTWTDNAESARFRAVTFALPSADQWLFRVTLLSTTNESGTVPSLYNAQEEINGTSNYPDSALLSITGIASNQIQSFEAMRGSARVRGRKVKQPVLVADAWDGSTYATAWTDNRAWVLRDLLTNTRVGLGHRIPEAFFNDAAAVEAAVYWDTVVEGSTRRDSCNLLLNDRRAAWDWIKTVLNEGRASLLPSGGQLTLAVEQARSPGLLYSVPGNVLEGSVTRTMGTGEGEPPNTIRGQYPDTESADRLQILVVQAAGTESDPVKEQLVTLLTLTNTAHVYWQLRYELLRLRDVARRVKWSSPLSAMPSEVFDVVTLSYATPNYARGVSGYCPGGSTTTRLLLDRPVVVAPTTTYSLLVRHQADNTVERKTLATGTGTWGAIAPTVAFSTAPAEGDLWALGVQDTALLDVLVERITLAEDHYELVGSAYQATLYATPTPPASPGRSSGAIKQPLPLWHAAVRQIVAMDDTGVSRVYLSFSITPQMQSHADQVPEALPSDLDQIRLSDNEPYGFQTFGPPITEAFLDHFYTTDATITIIAGTGIGQTRTLTDYHNTEYPDAPHAIGFVTPNWVTAPATDSVYRIDWAYYNEVGSFLVEESPLAADPFLFDWVPLGTFVGLTGMIPARAGTYDTALRFTAISTGGVYEAHPGGLGRWVAIGQVTGDLTPPDVPLDIPSQSPED